jgi:hypothetical protein
MTRRVIAIEGRPTTDGRLIEVGVLKWDNEPIPVLALGSDPFPYIVGKATDLLREDDGKITADIQITGRELDDDEHPAIYVMNLECTTSDGTLRITQGRIADITLVGTWAWSE